MACVLHQRSHFSIYVIGSTEAAWCSGSCPDDAWRQIDIEGTVAAIFSEADRIKLKHLLTLSPGISVNQTDLHLPSRIGQMNGG